MIVLYDAGSYLSGSISHALHRCGLLLHVARTLVFVSVCIGHTGVSDWCAAAHWRHLANTIEQFVHGGDAALCQVTVITG